ncbi:MAG: ribonuclease R [Bacteroidetes bacterium]|nr:ribonuclease R [Bacteroidota bacterium]
MARKHNKRANKRSQSVDIKAYALQLEGVFRKYPARTFNYKQLASQLGYKPEMAKAKIEMALSDMERKGTIIMVDRYKYKLKYTAVFTEGVVDMASNGNAYVVSPDTESDIMVRSPNLMHALHGDRVKVSLFARRGGKKLEGEIVEIVERKQTDFVGTIEIGKSYGFLVPASRKMLIDIYIPKDKLGGAEHGQKAIARITDWPEKASSPFGEIIEVLGNAGEHNTEIHAVLAEFGLPNQFPEEVERAADELDTAIKEDEIVKNRRDFRKVPTFTIDPADAKDFDDALSLQRLENGHWEVGVHIADVSHYVKPDSILEDEAVTRATSVYLVDRVVPMLPEVLSNGACSLRPNEDKYTFSAVFEMDEDTKIHNQWFGRTAIHSDRRFAYEEAQQIIEDAHPEGKEADFFEEIRTLDKMAKIMREARMAKGALSFDKKEVKFKLDENNTPTGVYFKVGKDANHLIEEFMLLANRSVATFIGQAKSGQPSGQTFVYRIHDDPDPQKLQDLSVFVKQFGHEVRLTNKSAITRSLNKMLTEVKNTPAANMIETLTIRTMSKAKYTTQNIGHYGLAFDYYSHFTSPIRRYPDVMVHRLLQHYLDGGKSPDYAQYEALCEHSSEREKAASDAERASIKYMQAVFLQKHVGESFMGVISGVTEWGVYVELTDNYCEGMIRISAFRDDYYTFDSKNFCIEGERTGRIFQLGDPMKITVKNVDLDRKQIDFEPCVSED